MYFYDHRIFNYFKFQNIKFITSFDYLREQYWDIFKINDQVKWS